MIEEPTVPETSTGSVISPASFHPLSAWMTIILDMSWLVIEVPATISLALLPAILPASIILGLVCLIAVTLVQGFLAKDKWGVAVAKGFAMGLVAAVPYPVAGTAAGVWLLASARIHAGQKALPARRGN